MQSYLVPLDIQFSAWSMLNFRTMSVKKVTALAVLWRMPNKVWNLMCYRICFFFMKEALIWSMSIYISSFSLVLPPHSDKAPTIYNIHFLIHRGSFYMLCITEFIKQVEEKR